MIGLLLTAGLAGLHATGLSASKPFFGTTPAALAATPSGHGTMSGSRTVPAAASAAPASAPAASLLPTAMVVGKHFPGLSSSNSSCGCAPPDVQVAAGPGYVVEMVNTEGKIWTTVGAAVSSFSLVKFFGIGSNFSSDPKVLYDNLSGRFFASMLEFNSSTLAASVQLAVSITSNPTGSWYLYSLGGSPAGDFADQPILGMNSNLLVIGGNEFPILGGSFAGSELFAVNKSAMVHGLTAYFNTFGPFPARASMHPVHTVSASSTEFVVMTSRPSTLDVFKVTGTPSASTSAHLSAATALSVGAFSTPPSAPQKGTTFKVDTGDNRVLDAVWRAGTLWLTFNTGCVPSGDTHTRACLDLVQISTSPTLTVGQHFAFGQSGRYLFYGAVAMDGSSDVVLVYGYSNSTSYPALAVTAHLAGSPTGTLLTPAVLVKGSASVKVACTGGVCRWGDYYGAGADPKSANVWVAGEYVTLTTYWSTWVAQVRP